MKLYRLQDLREMNFWTQTFVAEKLQISQRAYSHYENGTREVPLDVLIKLSYLYNVSSDYLLGLTDNPIPYKPN
ncbi:MAG: helix-turn-helix transcriptional regulator [Lachnospiraceae bacterium]|nr:helix-turn-helix transcriptional regulator [Lachnospiraceae bacterium]